MKTLKNKFWALLLITSVAFLSCKKQDPLGPIAPANATAPTTTTGNPNFSRGEWRIDLFQEDSTNETSKFRGYLFTFNNNGTVDAKKDASVITGTWSTVKESDRMKFKISFQGEPLSELNGDWDVMGETQIALKLQHVSGGDGSVDQLNFGRYFAQADVGNAN